MKRARDHIVNNILGTIFIPARWDLQKMLIPFIVISIILSDLVSAERATLLLSFAVASVILIFK